MFEMKYPHLFSPLKVGNITLRNRIIGAPTGYLHMDAEGLPTQAAVAYYELKARGGAAVVTVGEGVDGGLTDKVLGVDNVVQVEGQVEGIHAVATVSRGIDITVEGVLEVSQASRHSDRNIVVLGVDGGSGSSIPVVPTIQFLNELLGSIAKRAISKG